jgi:hypothetical protein
LKQAVSHEATSKRERGRGRERERENERERERESDGRERERQRGQGFVYWCLRFVGDQKEPPLWQRSPVAPRRFGGSRIRPSECFCHSES